VKSTRLLNVALGGILCAALGCGKNSTQPGSAVVGEIGYGELAGHTYTNDYFQLKVDFPEEWYISSRAEAKEMMDLGRNVVSGGDPNKQALVDASMKRTLNLVTVYRYPPGTPTSSNPNIILMAENVRALPGVRNGADYLHHVRLGLQGSKLEYEFDPIEEGLSIGRLRAHCLPVQLVVGGNLVHQRYYATRSGGYVLSVILTFRDDEEQKTLEAILKSIKADGAAEVNS
jgi:hypothetical protein